MNVTSRYLWDARLVEIIEEGFDRCGIPSHAITSGQLRSALTSLRLQLIEWSADLQDAWAVETQEYPLTYGQKSVTLPVGALAVSEATYRDPGGMDTPVTLITREEYTSYPDKHIIGDRPTHLWVDKRHTEVRPRQLTAHMWQLPSKANSKLILNLIMTVQDATGMGQEPEVPQTWLDALCAAMAKRLSLKYAYDRYAVLRAEAENAEEKATSSTGERADIVIEFPERHRYR